MKNKILIIQNKFIGDVLVSSVLAKNIKLENKEAEIHFFCYDKAKGILENNPYIDKVITFNNEELKKISVLLAYSKLIRNQKYDILIDPYAKLQSRIMTLFSTAKIKISYDKPFFKYLYTKTHREESLPKVIQCTSIENRCLLLSSILKRPFRNLDFQTEIFLTQEEKDISKKIMYENGVDFKKPVLIIGVLGSSLKKSWPLNYMAELINSILSSYDVNLLFNYIPEQFKEVENLLDKIVEKEKIFTSILGNNIREFAAILSNCDALIANEGGSVNIAKALNIPTYSIFSPHKFRKDWGCYENLAIHQSFHLTDLFPEIYKLYSIKEILNNPEPFYKLMYTNKVIPKIHEFITETLKIEQKSNLELILNSSNKISAVCITYNEENNVNKFLKDIDFADEIIVVDSYSTDSTKELVEKSNKVKFLQRKFDNFTNQKNYAIDQVSNEWVIFFDLDERIPMDLKMEILMTINDPHAKDAYWVYRNFYFKNKHIKNSGWKNDKVIRLFKKNKCKYKVSKLVHEEMIYNSEPGFLKNKIDHYSLASVKSYEDKLDHYSQLKAKELFEKGKKANFFHRYIKPLYRFFHHYIIQYGILDGKEGFIISKIYARYVYNRYKYLDKFWDEKKSF
ncbi:glycosyltransferase [Apibacter muscae]|uniref:Glycosyltransferase n=1 Tax=Apibacter muscae TaxID=2509004 RepID=A0A563DC36_9FLAO|nr:glycosyltransferase family 9 protein [Apibacter muscae]TWP27334.1 glycosyltransferase [Apibacter muscae]TWP28554.1 glycosyltransferase [Apibacter muscae]